MQQAYQAMSQKLSLMTTDANKSQMYKETVKKQEQVILKLEGLLEKLMRERKQREAEDLNRAWQNHVETDQTKELTIKSLELKLKRQEAQIADL